MELPLMTRNSKSQQRTSQARSGALITRLVISAGIMRYVNRRFSRIGSFQAGNFRKLSGEADNALFRVYPGLKESVPWLPIGSYPTPVEELGSHLGLREEALLVKRDDLSSASYGGNKIRKLEFLLANARLKQRDTLITIGGTGSNHALATAIHGKSLGFSVELCLFNQPVTSYVKANLLGFAEAGARVHYSDNMTGAFLIARKVARRLRNEGKDPFFIMTGGTCGLSNLGHVSAALELKDQINRGLLPVPDRVFVPVGTCGTISGLVAGFMLAGLPTKVTGVQVADSFPANPYMIKYFSQDVLDRLHRLDPSIPGIKVTRSDFELWSGYLGGGYGFQTEEGIESVSRASTRLALETTYTGKTLAACLEYCREEGRDETVLFWNTYNSLPFPKAGSPEGLPEELKALF